MHRLAEPRRGRQRRFVTAFVVSGALPLLETLFRITTNISWLELADLNHPLLKRMTIEAPGTYHHSLVVANLAEAAAEAIGANATMCRVCSYFHDIGKLVKPEYFTENMRRDRNPHDELAPTMSALIIIAHVKEGVDLALKHGLNQEIIDVIQQHHGTSTGLLFLQARAAAAGGRARRRQDHEHPRGGHPGGARGELPLSGPDARRRRECAIISLADSHRKRLAQPRAGHAAEDRSAHHRHHRRSGSPTGSSRSAT